jgi:hypothetical protein
MLKELPSLQTVSQQNPAPRTGRVQAKKNGIGLNRPLEVMERLHLVSAVEVHWRPVRAGQLEQTRSRMQDPLSLEKPTFPGSHVNNRGASTAAVR